MHKPTQPETGIPEYMMKHVFKPLLTCYIGVCIFWNGYDLMYYVRRIEDNPGKSRVQIELIIEENCNHSNREFKKMFPSIGGDIAYMIKGVR